MAALKHYSAKLIAPSAGALVAALLGGFLVSVSPPALAQDSQKSQTQDQPSPNPPPEAQPKPPSPSEAKAGIVRPPNVDPAMSKPVPNVDLGMPRAPKPEMPGTPGNQGPGNQGPGNQGGDRDQGKSAPEAQPR